VRVPDALQAGARVSSGTEPSRQVAARSRTLAPNQRSVTDRLSVGIVVTR